ncbi:MAG: hypothetical protein PHY30_00070 [Candidatus Pacebacteria bacterium]|nr:hypothetical protein [Candidatus Paceibacterota bacterium]
MKSKIFGEDVMAIEHISKELKSKLLFCKEGLEKNQFWDSYRTVILPTKQGGKMILYCAL